MDIESILGGRELHTGVANSLVCCMVPGHHCRGSVPFPGAACGGWGFLSVPH